MEGIVLILVVGRDHELICHDGNDNETNVYCVSCKCVPVSLPVSECGTYSGRSNCQMHVHRRDASNDTLGANVWWMISSSGSEFACPVVSVFPQICSTPEGLRRKKRSPIVCVEEVRYSAGVMGFLW